MNDQLDRSLSFVVTTPATVKPTATTKPSTSCGNIPAGQSGLNLIHYTNDEVNFTIAGTLHKVPANGNLVVYLPPGNHNYSANIPGKGSTSQTLEIKEEVCLNFSIR